MTVGGFVGVVTAVGRDAMAETFIAAAVMLATVPIMLTHRPQDILFNPRRRKRPTHRKP
jgi:hypothetical protein